VLKKWSCDAGDGLCIRTISVLDEFSCVAASEAQY